MSQDQPEKPVTHDEGPERYKRLLAEVIARGEPIVPISKCGFIKNKTFTRVTIEKWIHRGIFPCIKIGFRRYTADSVIAQWIADGQMDKEVFGNTGKPPLGHKLPKKGENPFRGLTPWEKKKAERQRMIEEGLIEPDEVVDATEPQIDDADLYRID